MENSSPCTHLRVINKNWIWLLSEILDYPEDFDSFAEWTEAGVFSRVNVNYYLPGVIQI